MTVSRAAMLLIGVLVATGCRTEPYDYASYLQDPPRSILILPPLDRTPEVDAAYGWLSTVSHPLAEAGYYVFPVGMVDRILRENGLPNPAEMHGVSRQRLIEVFGADAVLYVTVTDWGTEYQVLNSQTSVSIQARLVDLDTGRLLWQGTSHAERNSSDGNQGILAMLIGALVNQVVTDVADPSRDLSSAANRGMIGLPRGLLLGPRHPRYEEDLVAARELVDETRVD